jgi:replicative DNA helicase
VNEITPPSSIESERSILGGIILDPGLAIDAIGALRAESFHLDSHRRVFSALSEMHEHGIPIDFITVKQQLARRGELEAVGGETFVYSLSDGVPKRKTLDHLCKVVQEKFVLRSLLYAMNATANRIAEGDMATDCIAAIEEALLDVRSSGKQPRHISELMHEAVEEIERLRDVQDQTLGLTLDFEPLDQVTTGIRRDELWVVGARPNVGKTPFAMQIALANASQRKKKVLIFTLEMSDLQLSMRSLIHRGGATPYKMRDPRRMDRSELTAVMEEAAETAKLSLWVDDSGSRTIKQIRNTILSFIRRHGIELVVIDYIQLVDGEGRSQYEITSNVSKGLRALVRQTKVPILALSQLNRNAKDPNKEPDLADLRESGVIEQEANVVILIHRPNDATEGRRDTMSMEGKFVMAKVREGFKGSEPFIFNEDRLIFEPKYAAGLRK